MRENCRIGLNPAEPLVWTVIVKAPEGSIYYPGVFTVQVEFAENYPFKAPIVRHTPPKSCTRHHPARCRLHTAASAVTRVLRLRRTHIARL